MSVNDQFVTKQELAEAVRPLATKQDLAEVEERITDEVLRAFYNWARPMEVRLNRTDELTTPSAH